MRRFRFGSAAMPGFMLFLIFTYKKYLKMVDN